MRITTLFLIVFCLSACSGGSSSHSNEVVQLEESVQPGPPTTSSIVTVDDEGTTSIENNDLAVQLDLIAPSDLSEAEASDLVYMREEEMLAHDLYVQFYEKWEKSVFTNIAAAELSHTNAVLALLDRYEIPDPASTEAGFFNNIELQNLYDYLLASGSASFIDALLAAAIVEEVDILDLEAYSRNIEGNDDIVLVYQELLKGSRNHLRAFVRNLEKQGISYTPVHLEQAAYDAIITSEMERG